MANSDANLGLFHDPPGAPAAARRDEQPGVIPTPQGGRNDPAPSLTVPRHDAAAEHLSRHNILGERIRGHLTGSPATPREEHPDINDHVWSRFNPNGGM
jgi:hypothetical protein